MKFQAIFCVFLFMSFNSFSQWTQQESSTTGNLTSIHFLNDSVGFVVGNNGVFIKTYDRGQNWNLTVINASDNLYAVWAINVDTIFAGGNNLYKSTDGGQNWNIVLNQFNVYELKFFTSMVGFLKNKWFEECGVHGLGDNKMQYYLTTDGGNTWQLCSELPIYYTVSMAEMDIVSADTAYVVGNVNYFEQVECVVFRDTPIYKSTDRGNTWQFIHRSGDYSWNIDASFLNGWEGYYLNRINGYHLYKINGGGSDFVFVADIAENTIGNLVFATLYEGYYNSAGKIMKTTSGGILWEEDYNGPTSISKMVITTNNEGYAIGNSGLILHKKINPSYEPQSLLNIDNTSLDFPVTNINGNSNLSFVLRAAGNEDITVDIASPLNFLVKTENSEDYVSQFSGLVIPSLHDTIITVQFTPSDYANYSDTILITSNSTNNPIIKLPVRGRGVCFMPQLISNDTILCYDTIKVRTNVTVELGQRLTICPGTKVVLQGDYEFDVAGSLFVRGIGEDNIRFFPELPGNTWSGFNIAGQGITDSIIFDNCIIKNCKVMDNQRDGNGGAIYLNSEAYILINNTEFQDCKASKNGGGIYITGSVNAKIDACKFIACTAEQSGGGIIIENTSNLQVQNCNIILCQANDKGGGIAIISSLNSTIENCQLTSNTTHSGEGGGIFVGTSLVTIVDNLLKSNIAAQGAGICSDNSSPNIINNTIMNNVGLSGIIKGAGIYIDSNYNDQAVNIVQNVIYSNKANGPSAGGTGIYIYHARANILLNNILSNVSQNGTPIGGGIFCHTTIQDSVMISGNIIYDNTPVQIGRADLTSPMMVDYNDIEGGWNFQGIGNTGADPDFYSEPAGIPDSITNYYFVPSFNSPCIDNGITDIAGLMIPLTDFAGNPRIVNNRLDIGVYENCFDYQSFDVNFCPGENLKLEVIPSLPGTFSYAWTHNHETVSGNDSNILVLNSVTTSDEGFYQCIAQHDSLILKSRYIHLDVSDDANLKAIIQPVSNEVILGTDHTLVFEVSPHDSNTVFQWYFNDELMEGENQSELTLHNFSEAMQGIYYCQAGNNCTGIVSDDAVLSINHSGIDELDQESIVVSPNPASLRLTVGGRRSPVTGHQSQVRFEIYDLYGRNLMSFEDISSFPINIDISSLSPGMYILRIEGQDGVSEAVKFLKAAE